MTYRDASAWYKGQVTLFKARQRESYIDAWLNAYAIRFAIVSSLSSDVKFPSLDEMFPKLDETADNKTSSELIYAAEREELGMILRANAGKVQEE